MSNKPAEHENIIILPSKPTYLLRKKLYKKEGNIYYEDKMHDLDEIPQQVVNNIVEVNKQRLQRQMQGYSDTYQNIGYIMSNSIYGEFTLGFNQKLSLGLSREILKRKEYEDVVAQNKDDMYEFFSVMDNEKKRILKDILNRVRKDSLANKIGQILTEKDCNAMPDSEISSFVDYHINPRRSVF